MAALRCRACGGLNNFASAREGKVARCGLCRSRLDVSGKAQGVREEELVRAVEGSPVPDGALAREPADPACRSAAGRLERVAARRLGELLALSVDVEIHPAFRSARGVASVPAFLLLWGRAEAGRRDGLPRAASRRSLSWHDGSSPC